MRVSSSIVVASLVSAPFVLLGCGGGAAATDAAVPADMTAAPADAAKPADGGVAADAAADAGTTGDAGVTGTSIRFAHLAPDVGAVDVCLAQHGGTEFTGPIFHNAGLANGLAYSQVSAYQSVAAGQYDVRVIPGGSAACTANVIITVTNLPAFGANTTTTIAAIGFAKPPANNSNTLQFKTYTDELNAPASGSKLRAINASPDAPAVDLGSGSGATFLPIFTNVSYPNFATTGTIMPDANGYITLPTFASAPTFSVRATGQMTDLLTVMQAAPSPSGTIASAFLIGDVGGTPQPLKALLCVDNAAPSTGLSSCQVLP